MTVITWDGKVLAADRQCLRGDTIMTARKLWPLENGGVMAVCGKLAHGMALKKWVENGMHKKEFPKIKEGEEWASLIIAMPGEPVVYFENTPDPIEICDPFAAWGVGREAALGAMAMECGAIGAVEIASRFVSGCGNGCDFGCVTGGKKNGDESK